MALKKRRMSALFSSIWEDILLSFTVMFGTQASNLIWCCDHPSHPNARDLIYPLGEGGHIAQVTDCRRDAVSALRRFIRYHLARFTACTTDTNPAYSFLLHPGPGCSSNAERIGFRGPTQPNT